MTMTLTGDMSATPGGGPHMKRLRFDRLPAVYMHPDRLNGLLPVGISPELKERLRQSSRLHHRLSAVLDRRFELKPSGGNDLDTPEGRFVQLDGEALVAMIRRAGAIWHANTISAIILAQPLRRLVSWLGRDNHRVALRHVQLSTTDAEDAFLGDEPDIEGLCLAIERDGLICINAWSRHQPEALAKRLRLKLPPGVAVDDMPPATHREQGTLIVDRIIMTMARPDDSVG
jgi:hypothetical protein